MFFESSERAKHTQLGVVAHMNKEALANDPSSERARLITELLSTVEKAVTAGTVTQDEYNTLKESIQWILKTTAAKKQDGDKLTIWEYPKQVNEALITLDNFKDNYFNVIGDDQFWDGIDAAIKRAKELGNSKP